MMILVTRPEPAGTEFAKDLEALGHRALVAPLSRIEPLPTAVPDPGTTRALVVTSANGLLPFASAPDGKRGAWRTVPIFAVGEATAARAAELGFTKITIGPGNGEGLARQLFANLPPAPEGAGAAPIVWHFGGKTVAFDIVAELESAGIRAQHLAVYRTTYRNTLPAEISAAMRSNDLDAAVHFSPASARALVDCAASSGQLQPLAHLRHYCLSDAVARALFGAFAKHAKLPSAGLKVQVSPKSNSQEVLALIGSYAAN